MQTARLRRSQFDAPWARLTKRGLVAVAGTRRAPPRRGVFTTATAGLLAGAVATAALLLALVALIHEARQTDGAAVLSATIVAGAILGACLAAPVAGLAVHRRERARTRRDLETIASTVETLSAHDVVVVVDALADIAQGEGARLLKIDAAPVAVPADRTLRRLAEAVNTTVARLESSVEQFNLGAVEPCRRLFYVGPDDFLLGSICAEELARMAPPDAELLVLLGRFSHAGMELRRRGFESGLRDRAAGAHVAAAFENLYDPALTYDFVRSFLRSHPRLSGIYSAEGVAVQGAARAVIEAGRARQISIVCHDLVEETIPHIRSGVVAGTVTQDAFGQGFETPIHLFNHVAFGWLPPEQRLSTRMEFVKGESIGRFWTPETGLLDSAVPVGARPQPFGRAPRPVRIAMIGIDDNPFWRFVRAGTAAAAELLAENGATVDWLDAGELSPCGGFQDSAFEQALADGYDAIATPIFELRQVPLVNRAIDAGIAVATYNSETASLGGLIAALSRQWRRVEETASRLQVSANQDALTGVGNRRGMEADLAAIGARADSSHPPTALIMVDIDRFKAYNDTSGHVAGDRVLHDVAAAIRRAIRPTDRVYRYGGEEFLIVLEAAGEEAGERAGQRVVSAVRNLAIAHPANPPWGVVTVSAGVALAHAHDDLVHAVERADGALYSAKEAGRNCASSFSPPIE